MRSASGPIGPVHPPKHHAGEAPASRRGRVDARPPARRLAGLLVWLPAMLLAACGDDGVGEIREAPLRKGQIPIPAHERFAGAEHLAEAWRFRRAYEGDPRLLNTFDGMTRRYVKSRQEPPYQFTAPDAWRPTPLIGTRFASFSTSGEPPADIQLSILPLPEGDPIRGNVERWYGQMGQAPPSAEEIAALPRIPLPRLADQEDRPEAVRIALEGDYDPGMPGTAPMTDAGMRAVIVVRPDHLLFGKLVGPAAEVTREADRFDRLVASLAPGALAQRAASGHGGRAPSGERPARTGPYQYEVPEGWSAAGPSGMRMETLTPPDTEATALTLTRVGGDVRGNLDRWRSELGLDPLSDEAFEALPRIQVLGSECPLLIASGDRFTGTGNDDLRRAGGAARLFGVVCPLDQGALFIKMTGPPAEMEGLERDFVRFCESLEVAE